MGIASYDKDVILWSREQAALLRSGQFSQLDIEHLADEIEDVGKSEQRELANRMTVLLAHLLKWHYQPKLRAKGGKSWRDTIDHQRERIARRIDKTPVLKATAQDPDWLEDTWADATALAAKETGLSRAGFGIANPWTMEQVLSPDWLPD